MAADDRAAALGLHAGMAVTHAQAMVPGLMVVEADPAADAAALARLAAWCLRQYSPLVADDSPDGILLDVAGCTHLFGGEHAMLTHLTFRLARAGEAARAAVADTPGAAHGLARYARATVTILPAGADMAGGLGGLPIAALRLADATVQALRTLGFDTIGQLMAAPRAPLTKRVGMAVLRRLDQATGATVEPIEPIAAANLPRTRMGFPEPIATPDDLARAIALLAERLCEKLTRQGLGASRLDLVFGRVDGVTQAIRIGTSAATRDAGHLVRLLTAKLETIDPGFGIEAMVLSAPLALPLGACQTMSALCTPSHAPDLSGLIDTLTNRLGPERVFRMRPVESDVPERSVRAILPLARAEGTNWPDRLPRPPRLFTPPRHIEAIALLPDHAPVQFTWRRRAHRIRRADGPERVFGEWWNCANEVWLNEAGLDAADAGPHEVGSHEAWPNEVWAVRDYFQVEDEAGQRFWLFRRGDGEHPDTGDLHWFLHGLFG